MSLLSVRLNISRKIRSNPHAWVVRRMRSRSQTYEWWFVILDFKEDFFGPSWIVSSCADYILCSLNVFKFAFRARFAEIIYQIFGGWYALPASFIVWLEAKVNRQIYVGCLQLYDVAVFFLLGLPQIGASHCFWMHGCSSIYQGSARLRWK